MCSLTIIIPGEPASKAKFGDWKSIFAGAIECFDKNEFEKAWARDEVQVNESR